MYTHSKYSINLKSLRSIPFAVSGLKDAVFIGEQQVEVAGGEVFSLPISIAMDAYDIDDAVTSFTFSVSTTQNDGTVVSVEEPSKFLYR